VILNFIILEGVGHDMNTGIFQEKTKNGHSETLSRLVNQMLLFWVSNRWISLGV